MPKSSHMDEHNTHVDNAEDVMSKNLENIPQPRSSNRDHWTQCKELSFHQQHQVISSNNEYLNTFSVLHYLNLSTQCFYFKCIFHIFNR